MCQKVKLYSRLFQERIPTPSWNAVIMGQVQPVFLLASLSKILKYVGQQHHVCGYVQVMVVAQRLTAKRIPNFLRMRVIFVCYAAA